MANGKVYRTESTVIISFLILGIDHLPEVKSARRLNSLKSSTSLELSSDGDRSRANSGANIWNRLGTNRKRLERHLEKCTFDRLAFPKLCATAHGSYDNEEDDFRSGERGIGLFDGEEPHSGDVTLALGLWDAGTECNEEPGVGENQAPRQMEAGAGMAEDAPVRLVTDVGDGYSYPYTSEVIRVTREVEMW